MIVLLYVFMEDLASAAQLADRYSTGYLRARVQDPAQHTQWLEAFDAGYDRQAEQLVAYVQAAWAGLGDV